MHCLTSVCLSSHESKLFATVFSWAFFGGFQVGKLVTASKLSAVDVFLDCTVGDRSTYGLNGQKLITVGKVPLWYRLDLGSQSSSNIP